MHRNNNLHQPARSTIGDRQSAAATTSARNRAGYARHVTGRDQAFIARGAGDAEVAIVEIGGTVGT